MIFSNLPDGAKLTLFVTSPQGVESQLAEELRLMGFADCTAQSGGASLTTDWTGACRICLWSRLANRALMPLGRTESLGPDTLYETGLAIDWPEWFDLSHTFAIQVAGTSRSFQHTHFAAQRLKDAIVDRFRARFGQRPDVDPDHPDVNINLHMDRAIGTISIDLSGGSLHRRGYRRDGAEAPLKENLAAAILMLAKWPQIASQQGCLFDPMCGSGTLLIEGAMMAADIAPGLLTPHFGGSRLKCHDPKIWHALLDEARQRQAAGLRNCPPIFGQDLDPAALQATAANARRAGVASLIQLAEGDVLSSVAPPTDANNQGLLITNPPYGVRLGSESELIKLYSLLGGHLKSAFAGWHVGIFSARPDLGPRLGLRAHAMHSLRNGALECKLLLIDINAAPVAATPPPTDDLIEQSAQETSVAATAPPPVAGELAPDLANRLNKNLRHLRRWASREGIECFRAYDADLPDYAVAVDVYPVHDGDQTQTPQTHLLVQEYAAPATIEPAVAQRRLRAALQTVQEIFQVPAAHLHYRLRKQQKGTSQYERQDHSQQMHEVNEHGCRLWVNFDDFLDTGVFLDHRPLRLRIQKEAADKRFLNLFCYTATASLHAARGGAKQTTSVDLSATYLDWAAHNFELNGWSAQIEARRSKLYGQQRSSASTHRLIQADCLAWLDMQGDLSQPPQFDLILCDPPTFSNSKRMEDVLDTQRDHVQLIEGCLRLLAPGGTLYFSTNRRRFKFDEDAVKNGEIACEIRDITAQTLGEDFKRPPPAHRCWKIQRLTN